MTGLQKTIAGLVRGRRKWGTRLGGHSPMATGVSRLSEVTGFGSNPGNLRMLTYVPAGAPEAPALVVVLHGCTQTAAGYDHGAGWSTLADRYGFVLLFPEQQRSNNPKTCFNWFQPEDIARDRGEALSIRQMVERMIRDHRIDKARVFVTGLSAGGAMTCVMLATYPEVFAGGAVIAGLPYGAAKDVPGAFDAMFKGSSRPARQWGDLVRAASPHRGPWPKLSVWHGSADATVIPRNAAEIVKQWTDVHGLPADPNRRETVDGYPRRVWRNAAGEDVIEEYTITGMAHGTPLATGTGDAHFGAAGPFLLEVGISSSYHIAKFWGLTGTRVAAQESAALAAEDQRAPVGNAATPGGGFILVAPPRPADTPAPEVETRSRHRGGADRPPPIDVGAVITKALRAAGLMK